MLYILFIIDYHILSDMNHLKCSEILRIKHLDVTWIASTNTTTLNLHLQSPLHPPRTFRMSERSKRAKSPMPNTIALHFSMTLLMRSHSRCVRTAPCHIES